jgi:hypothetical protein
LKGELDSETVAKWMRIVLQNAQKSPSSYFSSMLGSCEFPEDRDLAILLFKYLTRPEVNWRISTPFMPQEHPSTTSGEVRFSGGGQPPSTTFVREVWKEFFHPNLEQMAPDVESILSERLRGFHSAYLGSRGDDALDPLTRQWERIRFDDEERVTDERYILPACGKELMDRLLQNMPGRAATLIDRWARSNVPILEVLATYGVVSDPQRTADEKIGWVLDKGWLLSRRTAGEPGRVIIDAYSGSRTEVQEDALERVQEREEMFDEEERTGRLRMTRKLLVNLSNVGSDGGRASSLLEEFDERHPDLQERPVSAELSTEARDHILRPDLDPEEDLDKIRDLFSQESEPWHRHKFERQLEQVLRDAPDW